MTQLLLQWTKKMNKEFLTQTGRGNIKIIDSDENWNLLLYKANLHKCKGASTTKVNKQGSEDRVNFPLYDSAHGFFLGALSAEHSKNKTAAEYIRLRAGCLMG